MNVQARFLLLLPALFLLFGWPHAIFSRRW
jgi:hypothetical protein